MNIWKTWLKKLLEAITGKAKDVVNPPDPASVPTSEPIKLWPAYSCPSYAGHGYPSENTDREAAHAGARSAGLDCIAFKLSSIPNPELSIHLFWYESNVDKGKFLGTWYKAAQASGITRWQIDISACSNFPTAYDRFKAYPANSVQWMIGRSFTAEDMKTLHCDNQGIKISEPEYRK